MEIMNLPVVAKLEEESYPADEAASAVSLEYRIVNADHLCYTAFQKGTRDVVGFIVGTGAPDDTKRMTEEMMREHCPSGNVLCIHSVVIRQENRRKGLGTEMMTAYLRNVAENTNMRRVLLLSKRRLVPFYEGAGFQVIGESSISHGKDTWIELTRSLP